MCVFIAAPKMKPLFKYITDMSKVAYNIPLPILFDIFDLDDSKNALSHLGSVFDRSYKNTSK